MIYNETVNKNHTLIAISVIAAVYTVLCLILEPLSFGPIQFRLSELLCLLAIDYFPAVWGLTLGTFISNLFFGGMGIVDVIMGTTASFIASVLAYSLRKKKIKGLPVLSCLSFVLVNAVIVGSEFGIIAENIKIIPISMLEIGISELAIMAIGLPLYPRIKEITEKTLHSNKKR